MINSAALTALTNKMTQYFGLVQAKLKEKAPVVAHSANTLKLASSTLAEMVASVAGYSSPHIARRDNPHAVTPEQTGSYSNDEFNALMAQKVSSGIIPISRYGTLSYLPAGVSGGFEGATTAKTTGDNGPGLREKFTMVVEDNGTLTFLRNGTDGSTYGVYYGYVLNAVQGYGSSKITVTTRRYRPHFVPDGTSVAYVYTGGTGMVAGRLQDSAGTLGNIFLALMNGTLDGLAHSEVWLDPIVWEDRLNRSEVIEGKDKVYILYNPWAAPGLSTVLPVDYELYEIPKAAFGTGQTVTPTKVTIGQCTGFLGAQYNTGNIRMAAVAEAKDTVTPAMVQHIGAPGAGLFSGNRMMGGSGRMMTQSAFNADGTKLRTLNYHDGRWQASGGGLQVVKFAWSWVLDLTTMTVTLDEGITPLTLELAAGPVLKIGGTITNPLNGTALMNYQTGDITPGVYITESGLIFTSRIAYSPGNQEAIYRGKWNSFSSVYDVLQAPVIRSPELRESLVAPLSYGTPVGDAIDGFRLLPGNQCLVLCRNSERIEATIRVRMRAATDPLVYNYQYQSVGYPEGLEGFKPGTERTVHALNTEKVKMVGMIHEMDDTSLKRVTGAVLMNVTGYNSRPVDILEDLTSSGVVSATMAQLDTLRDEIITSAGFNPATRRNVSIIEVIIPQNPDVPVFAYVTVTLENLDRRILLCKVTVSSRTGAIATLTLGPIILSNPMGIALGGNGAFFDLSNGLRAGSHWIYETADSFLIAGNSAAYLSYAGGANLSRYRFLMNKSDGSFQNVVITAATPNIVSGRWGGLPGYGLGEIYHQDFTTKLMFAKAARTKAEYLTWNPLGLGSGKVIVSQEVTQGWIVYFTENTPVIINGVVGTLGVSNIDLTTLKANPANSTFYVYVNMVAGVPAYVIYDHYETETTELMFIGTVTTHSTGINVIDVQKITKFAGFRLSTVPAGGSIPVTAGLPSREAHIDPNWIP